MLRTIFVIAIIIVGIAYAIQSPFYALLFYLWLAYFRPERWIWTDFLSQLNLSLIVGAMLDFAPVASLGYKGKRLGVTLLRGMEHFVQTAAQLG